jgi:hypothetical protein
MSESSVIDELINEDFWVIKYIQRSQNLQHALDSHKEH